jgi:molecular chaperone DnaJ
VSTHYDVLGIARSASAEEVKQAYHRRAREHHPDLRPGPPAAPAGRPGASGDPMVAVNEAWAVLGDPARRRAYDRTLGAAGAGRGPAEPPVDVDGLIDLDVDVDDLLGPEPEPPAPGPADAMVLVPVALLAMAIGAFAFSAISEAPVLLLTSVLLLALAGVCFLATPLLVLRRSASRRTPPRR